MMSRIQDAIAVLRGAMMVTGAGAKLTESQMKRLWANSSVRELLEKNLDSANECRANLTKDPKAEFDNLLKNIVETSERVSVVAEGFKQYSGVSNKSNANINNKLEVTGLGNNLDITSITLKELQEILSKRNGKINDFEQIDPMKMEMARLDPSVYNKDEKYVQEWMKYIAKHETKTTEPTAQTEKPPTKRMTSKKETVSNVAIPELSSNAKQRSVPSTRIGRLASFGSLFAGLGLGTGVELTKGALGLGGSANLKEALLSPANTQRIVDTLCKVRGAALKIGQILSIQDSNVVSPELSKAFERVRQSADYMPDRQVNKVLQSEFGAEWQQKFKTFDSKPFAAASIGQVHRGRLHDDSEVAVKIQYPGVGKSIESDIDNLVSMLKVWDVFPPGIFIDNIVKVAKRELAWEVDYLREAEFTHNFGRMLVDYPEYRVPKVIRSLTTKSILTTELVPGVPVDKCFDLEYSDRRIIAEAVFKLCLIELFEIRCMQSDPNWSNFLYDKNTKKLMLIDFGSTRFYSDKFIDNYRDVIRAAIRNDKNEVLKISKDMGFLTGYESAQMQTAHVNAVMILGEMFKYNGEYDFGKQEMTKRIADLVPTMVAHRLCPPPEEIYSIHRKLSGVLLLCSRLNVRFDCRPFYSQIVEQRKM